MNAPRDLSGILAELGQAPAVEPWRAGLLAARARIACSPSRAAGIWRDLPRSMRELLVSMATDRTDPEAAAPQAWQGFTPRERAAVGALARTWLQQLQGVEGLR